MVDSKTERGMPANIVRALAAAVSTVGFGQSALLALVPVVVAVTGLGPGVVGAVTFAGALTFLVAAPLWGRAGASIGLRPLFQRLTGLMVTGQALFAALMIVGVQSPAIAVATLLASRILYSFGAAGVMPHAQAAVVRATPGEARPSALARLSAALGVGRILGSLVTLAGPATLIAPLIVMTISPLALLATPRIDQASAPDAQPAGPKKALLNRRILPLLAIGFTLTFCLGQIQIVLGLFLQQRFGLDAHGAALAAGWNYAAVAVIMILAQILLVPRLGPHLGRNMRLGVAGLALGSLAIMASPLLWTVTPGMLLAGIGIAIATPAYTTCLVNRGAADEQAGLAGWLSSAHILGQGAGALVGGYAFAIAPSLPFAICAGGAAATVAALFRLSER